MRLRLLVSCFIVLGLASSGVAIAQVIDLRFPDVLPGAYFTSSVDRLSRKGIIKGYDDGRFAPHDYVTRGQVAVIIDRYDQTSIKKLREQVEQIRNQLDLGQCGDSIVQKGEECDDGNILGGDGCSAECLTELHCAGGYKLGEKFTAPDGCNLCTCTEAGVACTERACSQKKCFSSVDCPQGEICSVEQGDCRYPCPKGAVCIQACAGVCLPPPTTAICGNVVCDIGESAYPAVAGSIYCPQDCAPRGPLCANAICETGEPDEYEVQCPTGASSCKQTLTRRGSCPKDCEGGLSSCQQTKNAIDVMFKKNIECQIDTDCTVFVRACSPYQTCGKAVRRDAILEISSLVLPYSDICAGEETLHCSGCIPKKAICLENKCSVMDITP